MAYPTYIPNLKLGQKGQIALDVARSAGLPDYLSSQQQLQGLVTRLLFIMLSVVNNGTTSSCVAMVI